MEKGKKIAIFVIAIVAAIVIAVGATLGIVLSKKGGAPNNVAPPYIEIPEDNLPEMTTRIIKDTNDVLLNPGKGFVHYGGDYNTYTRYERDYFTTGYHRYRWSDLEPSEGVYDFSRIDDWLEDYVHWGKKFAFGVMCVDASSSYEYVTPKFVFDDMESYDVTRDKSGNILQYIPNWTDEGFLSHLNRLVKKLGEVYDSNPNVVFIDILSYGNYGEQHLYGLNVTDKDDYAYNYRITPEFLRDKYVQPYIDAFPTTLLVNPWGMERYDEVYVELFEKGVTLRRDGIGEYTNGLDALAKAYGKLPVIFEYAGNYKDCITYVNGEPTAELSKDEEDFNKALLDAIAISRPSYIELDNDWFVRNRDLCSELANKMGYYFRLKQGRFYEQVEKGKETTVKLSFENDGVAPLYEDCTVFVGILDESGNVVQKVKTSMRAKNWLPEIVCEESVTFEIDASLKSGKYELAVGLFLNENDENPTYLLGSEGNNGNGWYVFGETNII